MFIAWAQARREPQLLNLSKRVGLSNEQALQDRMLAEAAGTATWSRKKSGLDNISGPLAYEVDLDLAESNSLALT